MKYALSLLFSFLALSVLAQSPKKAIKKLGTNPVFFMDSVSIEADEMKKYNPNDIASVSVYKDSTAIALIGPDGKDGVVYIETKTFARNRYWNYFRLKSPEYMSIILTPESDTVVQYILNKRVLDKNFEGDLASINDSIFKEIRVIDKAALEKEYGSTGKTYGIIILSDKPANLYRAKKKF